MLFQHCFRVVRVFDGKDAGSKSQEQAYRGVQHAARSEPREGFSAEFLFFTGSDEPLAALCQT
jgi:hypothetical protein